MMLWGVDNNGVIQEAGADAFKSALQKGWFGQASLTGIEDIGIVCDTMRRHAADIGIKRIYITLDRHTRTLRAQAWPEEEEQAV